MRLYVVVLFALVSFVCGEQDENKVLLNSVDDVGEAHVNYETLVRILDEEFPNADPDTLNCGDILGIYFEWTNMDDDETGYQTIPVKVQKVRRATNRRRWPKKAKMVKEIRDHHLTQFDDNERQRKMSERMRACGCWARRGASRSRPSTTTTTTNRADETIATSIGAGRRKPQTTRSRAEEPVAMSAQRSKPQATTKQKTADRKSMIENFAKRVRSNNKAPKPIILLKSSNNVKVSFNPKSLQQAMKSPTLRSRVRPLLQLADRQGRTRQIQRPSGSLVKETLQALNRHGQHLDPRLADAFAQTLGVENKNIALDKIKDLKDFGKKQWEKIKQSEFEKFKANQVDIKQQNLHVSEDDNLEGGARPLAEKLQNKEDEGPTGESFIQERSNDHWYLILIGCLLGVCALLGVSLVFVLCRRRRRKITNDAIDCKFDTTFKDPTVFVSVSSGSLNKKKMESEKKTDEQSGQDNDPATQAAGDNKNSDVKNDSCESGHKPTPDYENVVVPPPYDDVVRAENEFEQHV